MGKLQARDGNGEPTTLLYRKNQTNISYLDPLTAIDLTGLETVSRLRELRLPNNAPLSLDLAPLASLQSLETLTICVDEVPDFAPAGTPLSALTTLRLDVRSDTTSLESLAALSSLQTLSLTTTSRSLDLSPLTGLPLKQLTVSARALEAFDLSPLAGHTLERLSVILGADTPWPNLDALAASRLNKVQLVGGAPPAAPDFSPLAGQPLEYFGIRDVQTAFRSLDLRPLANPSLRVVIIAHQRVDGDVDLTGFERCFQLGNVDFQETIVGRCDVTPLVGLDRLRSVWLPEGAVIDPTVTSSDARSWPMKREIVAHFE